MEAILYFEGNRLYEIGPASDGIIEIPPGTLIFIPGEERPLVYVDPVAAE